MKVMFKKFFDENLDIGNGITWSALKYGLCSYFALAYSNKHPKYNRFLAIMEYDQELKKEYLVHYLITGNNVLIDAYGTYKSWRDSISDMTDIEYMSLLVKEVNRAKVIESIEKDMGFSKEMYKVIQNFVNAAYV